MHGLSIKKNVWSTGKNRIEGGPSWKQEEFRDRKKHVKFCPKRFDKTDVWYLDTGNQSCSRMYIRINVLF